VWVSTATRHGHNNNTFAATHQPVRRRRLSAERAKVCPLGSEEAHVRRYNIVDLFAGTGGMGLAALSVPCFERSGRIVWTAEINPRYVDTIKRNYRHYAEMIGTADQVPRHCVPTDLSKRRVLEVAKTVRSKWNHIDIALAGPPCQGFSLANRLSRTHDNPMNRLSLAVLPLIRVLEPRLFILENVPGIRTLRTATGNRETTMQILQRRLRGLGYSSSVLVLNAADYGVPQFRLRSFLVAVRQLPEATILRNLVPTPTHGPGRALPFVTVNDALGDLPPASNGSCSLEVRYASSPRSAFQALMRKHSNGHVSDHLTTRHSPYVLKRYAKVPQGGNWMSIRSMMSNYEDPDRTHLNIYHRLNSREPARTIGNFRKAMTIHPDETRGLSLREAARLQSIPDWFTFADPLAQITRSVVPGLNQYQQQIGNAVSYLLTEKLLAHVAQALEL
jgi:DNA (cytosine-5)-methyltransferase 1